MLPLLLAAAVGVAVVAHLRHWHKSSAPAPGEEVEEELRPLAQTDDPAESQEAGGKVEETQPKDEVQARATRRTYVCPKKATRFWGRQLGSLQTRVDSIAARGNHGMSDIHHHPRKRDASEFGVRRCIGFV